jgi:hypothetical protein
LWLTLTQQLGVVLQISTRLLVVVVVVLLQLVCARTTR